MNFHGMPELGGSFGYPFAIGLMGVVCVSVSRLFGRGVVVCRHRGVRT